MSEPMSEPTSTEVHARPGFAGTQTFATEGSLPPPAPVEVPAAAGRYHLLHEIGRGGMGTVWRAHDPDLNRPLAIKMLLAAGRPDLERRFLEEAQVTGQLQHPGIPPVHEIGKLPDGRPFFAM